MGTPIQDRKRALRRQIRMLLHEMAETERAAASTQARALLARQAIWKRAHSILFFAPTPTELDLWPLLLEALGAGKKVALPRFLPESKRYIASLVQDPATDVKPGYLGIREPAEPCTPLPLDSLDFILVPGLAFDAHGRRLGRGKGFYDKILLAVRGATCGVAFDQQIVPEVPVAPHDASVKYLLTPTRWIEP